MSNDKIKKCCPKCGFPFIIPDGVIQPNLLITCKACGAKSPFAAWNTWKGKTEEPGTQYVIGGQTTSRPTSDEMAVLKLAGPEVKCFPLKLGKNVIGRYSASSGADIQIDTDQMHTMSREHAIIEVSEANGKYWYKFSLYKEKLNETKVAGMKLTFGDKLYLNSGDKINLAGTELEFRISQVDATSIE